MKRGRFANAEGVKQSGRITGIGKLGKCQLCMQFSLHGKKGNTLLWQFILNNCNTEFLLIDLFIMKVGLRMNSLIHFFSNYSHPLNLRPLAVTHCYTVIFTIVKPFHIFFVMLSGYCESDKYAI